MPTPERLRILRGDNRETILTMAPDLIQTIITSPPYWSVRDYNTPAVYFPTVTFTPAPGLPPVTIPEWLGQLGLEPDPWAFIGHLVDTFRHAKARLRRDGTLWVNMGDTYQSGDPVAPGTTGPRKARVAMKRTAAPNRVPVAGLPPKSLVGIPWMLAKAMQADGWTLRSEVIWHKPNASPSSTRDRPACAHETVFLFSLRERYFYDGEAIKEEVTGNANPRGSGVNPKARQPSTWDTGPGGHDDLKGRFTGNRQNESFSGAITRLMRRRNKRSVWSIPTAPWKGDHAATFPPDLVKPCLLASTSEKGACPRCAAPWVRVLVPAPMNADYADPVTTGWRPTCTCGAPKRLGLKPDDMEAIETPTGEQLGEDTSLTDGGRFRPSTGRGIRMMTRYEHRKYAAQLPKSPHRKAMEAQTVELCGKRAFEHYMRTDPAGARPIPPQLLIDWIANGWLNRVAVPEWKPLDPVPCLVADIFAGTGTVGAVALEYGRAAVLCELAEHYLPQIEQRTNVTPALLTLA